LKTIKVDNSIYFKEGLVFFLYSKSCEYAVRVLTQAAKNPEGCFRVTAVCRLTKVPLHYARKAIEQLAAYGLLEAVRGPGGGYRFLKPVSKITILELVKAIDGSEAFDRCVMGLPECGDRTPCPLHETWVRVKSGYLDELHKKTLADLAAVRPQAARRGYGSRKRKD